MSLSYFNQGFKVFLSLSILDFFKHYLLLQPAEMQFYQSIISLPWSIKLLYGLVADNFPICGSTRKAYLLLSGLISFLSLLPLVFHPDPTNTFLKSPKVITACLTLNGMAGAFVDVIIDALMVQQSRKDPIYGSEDLNSYSWLWLSVGGASGCFLAAYLTQYLDPYYSFMICEIVCTLLAMVAFHLNDEIDQEASESYNQLMRKHNAEDASSFQRVAITGRLIWKNTKNKAIYQTLLYFLMIGVLVPSFGDVQYYFTLNVLHFSKFTFSLLNLLSFLSLFAGILLYNKFFKNFEIRTMLQMSIVFGLIGCTGGLVLVYRWNVDYLGVSDLAFVVVTSMLSGTFALAFSFLPTLVLFTKITPNHIEASMFALFTGVFNFSGNVAGPLVGSYVCKAMGVDSDHLDKMSSLLLIQMACLVVSFSYIFLVPRNSELNELQAQNIKESELEKANHSEL